MEMMHNFTRSKEMLLKNLDRVSEKEIQEISDFVEFVLKKRSKKQSKRITLVPKKDPVLRLIGIADTEPFSGMIDEEIYGL